MVECERDKDLKPLFKLGQLEGARSGNFYFRVSGKNIFAFRSPTFKNSPYQANYQLLL